MLDNIKEFFTLKNILIILFIIIAIIVGFFSYNYIKNQKKPKKEKEIVEEIKDSDNDTLSDEDEVNIYKTNPEKKDTDGDDLDDAEELKAKTNPNIFDTDNDGLKDGFEVKIKSNPNNMDTDGDGLLDGKAQFLDNKVIAPADSNPVVPIGPKGVWQKQIQLENARAIPTYLTDFYKYNPNQGTLQKDFYIDWNHLQNSKNIIADVIKSPYFKEFASAFLNFRLDNGGVVLHSQTKQDNYKYMMSEAKSKLSPAKYQKFVAALKILKIDGNDDTWQKRFGYNDLYDQVFNKATNSNMRSAKIYFNDAYGQKYVLWIWRGDYLALGSGAEMGLYKKRPPTSDGTTHWDAVDFEVPMTLNLYNFYNEQRIENIFNWKPNTPQWWITGFNTNFSPGNAKRQVIIGSVDFSGHRDMYESLKEQINKNQMKNFMVFDDETSTIWINWYDK